MRCKEVRTVLEQMAEGLESINEDSPWAGHVKTCPACATFWDEMTRTWRLMGTLSPIEPSADFRQKLHQRLQAPEPKWHRRISWSSAPGWQWMAVTAIVITFGLLLGTVSHIRSPHSGSSLSQTDLLDEKLLNDIDQSIRTTGENHLSVYDSWSTAVPSDPDSTKSEIKGSLKDRKRSAS